MTSPMPTSEPVGSKRFADFDLGGKTFIVTGGARGLGLAIAEALVEAGGQVYCFDIQEEPDEEWEEAQSRVVPEWGGQLLYCQQDVRDTDLLEKRIEQIADKNGRLNGVVAAAAFLQTTAALDYAAHDVSAMLATNYTAVFVTAQAAARAMMKHKTRGSICMVASMSGLAALIQLARNLAMEWSPVRRDGTGGIRVNCLSPGHIETPMVLELFEKDPEMEKTWTRENMMGRLATTGEFKGAALFLISSASSFMTGNNLVVDGGHTAW
ncbi:oxidoreductase [Cordyceps fumosorosea ARSEF 2679]|uniref:Oxidoreductase n=1 Tax=Cordyceps fumosorosea (strain ARSEF 2679) TaxID=1081104 RepID=A0A167DYQ5_CORFA|nr:oxidoreductase [Cordyceps fumosorosea ARSEF 2679]OAA43064.1 oxidoreductase [Cordyceps fumosorosea ARSEF 2679]